MFKSIILGVLIMSTLWVNGQEIDTHKKARLQSLLNSLIKEDIQGYYHQFISVDSILAHRIRHKGMKEEKQSDINYKQRLRHALQKGYALEYISAQTITLFEQGWSPMEIISIEQTFTFTYLNETAEKYSIHLIDTSNQRQYRLETEVSWIGQNALSGFSTQRIQEIETLGETDHSEAGKNIIDQESQESKQENAPYSETFSTTDTPPKTLVIHYESFHGSRGFESVIFDGGGDPLSFNVRKSMGSKPHFFPPLYQLEHQDEDYTLSYFYSPTQKGVWLFEFDTYFSAQSMKMYFFVAE